MKAIKNPLSYPSSDKRTFTHLTRFSNPIPAKGVFSQGKGQVIGIGLCEGICSNYYSCHSRQRVLVIREDGKKMAGLDYWVGCRPNWILEGDREYGVW